MSQGDGVKDRRKYQRVVVESLSDGLTAEVVQFGRTLLYDMSYEGAAFAQPKDKKVESQDEDVVLHLKTPVDEAFLVSRPVRLSPEVVAVKFTDIDVAARIIIDRVVSDRIIGLNMILIDPKHYHLKSDFTHWYHGPKETNLYLWWKSDQLERAQMDLSSASLLYDGESFFYENKNLDPNIFPRLNNHQILLKSHAILQQMGGDGNPALLALKQLIEQNAQI
jgi:hypothetical protein